MPYKAGVIHRRIERIRRRCVQDAEIHDIGLSHPTIPIPDPEKEAIHEPQSSLHPEGVSETGDPQNWFQSSPPRPTLDPSLRWLEADFVPFEERKSSSDDSDDSKESLSNYINSTLGL